MRRFTQTKTGFSLLENFGGGCDAGGFLSTRFLNRKCLFSTLGRKPPSSEQKITSQATSKFNINNSTRNNSIFSYTSFKPMIKEKRVPKNIIEAVEDDKGLAKFVKKVYLMSGVGISGTLTGAWVINAIGGIQLFTFMPHFIGVGFIASIIGCVALDRTKYTINEAKTESINSPERLASFGLIMGGIAMTISPLFMVVNAMDPIILPTATLLSLLTMGGATYYAYRLPPGELMSWEKPMMAGLLGICGVGLTSLGASLIFGPNLFSATLHSIDVYGGIVFFSALTAYETHVAIDMYQKGDPDHLGCATNLFLDFINLFVRFVEIIANTKK